MEEVKQEQEDNNNKTRIYVGGLGSSVTEDDLKKTFSSLGQVVSVDIVRTKDRSFAYLDFVPSNDKSLPKLFSTYNGCMWKGGKLKLEKAKEHYLLRLKREWQEESELASKKSESCNADVSETQNTLEKSKKPTPADKTQFNIFFPKLGKVKSLAQVGIGKHKYSFQRIQVPDIPTHFCDCEEHSIDFPPPNKRQPSEFEHASYEINDQELDIMNSVMNKIFKRANPSKQVTKKSGTVVAGGVSANSNNKLVADDDEDNLTDEDNLIINVGSGNSDTMDLIGEMRSMMANQKAIVKRPATSTQKPKSVNDAHQKNTLPLDKKRKSSHSEETNIRNTITPETSRNSQTRVETSKDCKKVEPTAKQSDKNSLRSIKSSWKNLLGEKRNTSFNIPEFIATVTQREQEVKGDDIDDPIKENFAGNKKRKLDGDTNELVPSVLETTSSELHINNEPATEVSPVTTEISIPDILDDDVQQKQEGPKADNLDNDIKQKQEGPKADHLDNDIHQKQEGPKVGNLDIDIQQKREDPKADICEISDVMAGPTNQKEGEPRCDDSYHVENSNLEKLEKVDSQSGKSNDLKKPIEDVENSKLEKLEDTDGKSGNSNYLKKSIGEDLTRTARGEFWRHKSSWTQLISTTSHTSFSISHIVPTASFEKQEPQADVINSQPESKTLQIPTKKEVTLSPVKKKPSEKRKLLSVGNLKSDDTCPFMRTEESMKEWKKAKASASSSLNKKKKLVNDSA